MFSKTFLQFQGLRSTLVASFIWVYMAMDMTLTRSGQEMCHKILKNVRGSIRIKV
jgi:hypothetical protein